MYASNRVENPSGLATRSFFLLSVNVMYVSHREYFRLRNAPENLILFSTVPYSH